MLEEHEARPGTANESRDVEVPEMEPAEEKLVKLVMHLFSKSKKHRQKYDRHWLEYYKFFRGDQWTQRRPKYRHSEVINFVFQAIQSMIPIITDSRPKTTFLPQDPSDLQFADILNDLYEADWQKGGWLYKLTEVVYDAHFYGTGFSELKWDDEAEFGLGSICFKSSEPLELFPDPDANQINDPEEFSSFLITAKPKDTEKLRLKHRGHKFEAALKADLQDPAIKIKTSFDKEAFTRNRQTDKDLPRESFDGNAEDRIDKTLVITAYMKPADTVEEKKEDDDSVEFITKRKFPKGRRVVIINGRPFEDGPLKNDDKKFPFQKLTNYILPREFYGISEVEQLKSPQQIFNKLINFVLDVLTLAGNPVWLIPTASGVKPKSFTNAPGMQIPYDGVEPPRRAEGSQLQPFVMQIIDRMEKWFNEISGTPDISRGIASGSVTAASAIENLQDAAQTRLRQKMRNLDDWLVQVGEQYAQLALQHYNVPRIFRLTGKEDSEKYFRFHVERDFDETGSVVLDEKGDPVRIAVITNFKENDLKRMVPDEGSTMKFLIRGSFDIKVNTVTGLPFSKSEKEQRLLQLFDRGIIDERAVLERVEFPNFEPILERVEAAKAEAAQAQAQGG